MMGVKTRRPISNFDVTDASHHRRYNRALTAESHEESRCRADGPAKCPPVVDRGHEVDGNAPSARDHLSVNKIQEQSVDWGAELEEEASGNFLGDNQ